MTTRPRFFAAVLLLAAILPMHGRAADDACALRLCAGAATGDITPPVTTPMWGYTARHGVLFSADGFSEHLGAVPRHLAGGDPEGAANEVVALTQRDLLGDKTSGDVEGYAKTFVANRGIHLRLQANAFVLQGADGVKVAVVQTDLGGVPGEVHQAVAHRLAGTGIDREHLMIGATHSHHGPGGIFQTQGYALLGGDEFDPRVFEAVVSGVTTAVLAADARLAPAKMGWTQVETSNANRQRNTEQWCHNPESRCIGESPGPDTPSRREDRALTVIRLDRQDGTPLGVITNFAAHGTIGGDGNLLFSGDNQGWATRLVTQQIRAEAGLSDDVPIVNALINGSQGDVSPIGSGYNDYARMEEAGRRQAPFVLQGWRDAAASMRTDVTVDARFEFLCFCGQQVQPGFAYEGNQIDKADPAYTHVAPYAALGIGDIIADAGTSSPVFLPAQGHKLPILAGVGLTPSIVRLQTLRIGDLLFAGIPGEPNTIAGKRITDTLEAIPNAPWTTALIAGLANDYVSYFATPEEYTAHRYEGSFTLFGPQSTPLLTQELVRLATAMRDGAPSPTCDPATSLQDCISHVEQPDTSGLALNPIAPDQGLGPQMVSPPAPSVQRTGVVEATWLGGGPTAEWNPGADRVVVERKDGASWVRIAGDAAGAATVLRYRKDGLDHVWTAQYDVPSDAIPGSYRLRILGRTLMTGGSASAYTFIEEFAVTPLTFLTVTATPGATSVLVRAAYPFDPEISFRARPAVTGTATVVVDRVGTPVTLTAAMSDGTATIAILPGDAITSIAVTDAHGNSGTA